MSADRLLFLHLPKTAGVSARAYFDRHFHPDRVIIYRDGSTGAFPAAPCLITGHLYGGWIDRAPGDVVTATMIRDPVARVVSQYRYWRGLRSPATASDPIALARRHDLAEFVRLNDPRVAGSLRNLQTQMLGLDRPRALNEPMPDAATLAVAMRRLRRIDCVGVTEAAEDFTLSVAARCGWLAETRLPRLNPSTTAAIEIDPDLRREILERNALDAELHREASRLATERRGRIDPIAVNEAARARLASLPPASERTIALAGPFIGLGWSERQQIADHSWRWSAGAGASVMTGPMPSRAGRITLAQAPNLAKHDVVAPWLTLNDVALPLHVAGDDATLRADVPAGLFADQDANRVAIGVQNPRAMSEFLSNGDASSVGLALTAITLVTG